MVAALHTQRSSQPGDAHAALLQASVPSRAHTEGHYQGCGGKLLMRRDRAPLRRNYCAMRCCRLSFASDTAAVREK